MTVVSDCFPTQSCSPGAIICTMSGQYYVSSSEALWSVFASGLAFLVTGTLKPLRLAVQSDLIS